LYLYPLNSPKYHVHFLTMINPNQISSLIEQMVSKKGISYMEAVLAICEEHSLDASLIAKHLSKPIIENIEREAMEVNLLPKKKSLPFS
jgi:hypothetical protein